ncbi:NAD(P)/FAD-dependent oxidoreductase [Haloimpatiens sp. FM7315]|uniref:NAD(P)/FAD-dependent oxidoreductase n=1 Tax=Haloimpatiens sp. FM7315 TaxID=3298609 RepID=UPI0035A27B5B
MSKVIVIGGGPAGMMAAITASKQKNNKVVILEKNNKLGKKLFITGKGRCNVTNNKEISEFFEFIHTNSNFLYSALYTYTNLDTINFFENNGLKLKVERGDRIFPDSDKSSDIIKIFEKELYKNHVEVKLESEVNKFNIKNSAIESVELKNGNVIKGDSFILCTGGKSYPQTGSDGYGYSLSKSIGHNVIIPKPALVPLELKEEYVKELQGISLKNVEVKITDNKKILYSNFGEMIFTHFGVSGPIILTGSSVVNGRENLKLHINLKPALNFCELDKRIQKDFKKYSNKDFKNSLDDLLPKRLIEVIIHLSNIDPYKKVNLITKEERKILVELLQDLTLDIKGTRPIDEAIITSGGIDVKEIDPSTMCSKLISNLYFAGEIIDVDATTGGFNIQIALSTGYLSGLNA